MTVMFVEGTNSGIKSAWKMCDDRRYVCKSSRNTQPALFGREESMEYKLQIPERSYDGRLNYV